MIFRVNKNKDYTVISNIFLRDKNLSLKAKGIMSLMLSLPDDWNYSIKGLTKICKENETAIKGALKELIENNYLKRTKYQDGKGYFSYFYDLFEYPGVDNPGVDNPGVDNPGVDNPGVDNPGVDVPGVDVPGVDVPGLENHGQLSTKKQSTKKESTKKESTKKQSTKKENTKKQTNQKDIVHLADETSSQTVDDEWLEEMWKLYPRKEGKSQISKKSFKAILDRKEDFEKAIRNYAKQKSGEDKQYVLMGN